MGAADGNIIGTTLIAGSGNPLRWNLVILSEGYQVGELPDYALHAQGFVDHLFASPPFSAKAHKGPFRGHYFDAINVWRVDVSSTESGADEPLACGGTGVMKATYFDASFCGLGIARLLDLDSLAALNVAQAQVPNGMHWVVVMVNSSIEAGSGGAVAAFTTLRGHPFEYGLHELGHAGFRLADEYDYRVNCPDNPPNPVRHPADPYFNRPNVSLDPMIVPWGDLIDPATQMPTMSNPNCAGCDRRASTVPDGTIGAFEGADRYHCGAFRPEYHNCIMQDPTKDFCAVCQHEIRNQLWPYLPSLPSTINITTNAGAARAHNPHLPRPHIVPPKPRPKPRGPKKPTS